MVAKYFVSYMVNDRGQYIPQNMVTETEKVTDGPVFKDVDSFTDLASAISLKLAQEATGKEDPDAHELSTVHIMNVVRLPI